MGRGSRCELSRDGRRLRVVGPTDPGLADCLERYDGRPGLTVVVTSPGGDVDQAMRAAEVIGRRGWALEVLGLCGSSCGNYLVPAASRVEVAPYSVIGLHGCPDETNIANTRANGRRDSGARPDRAAHRNGWTRSTPSSSPTFRAWSTAILHGCGASRSIGIGAG
jgi:hypothetical protein